MTFFSTFHTDEAKVFPTLEQNPVTAKFFSRLTFLLAVLTVLALCQ